MPQLRKDPILGRWVIIATERAKRPDQYISHSEHPSLKSPCPFCEGNEANTAKEIYAIRPQGSVANGPGWSVRVIPSTMPFLRIEGDIQRHGQGLYDCMNGIGAHEVVVETPQHIGTMADLTDEQIAVILQCYADRIMDLEKDARFKYVLVFKNYGWSAGGSKVSHARSQLIATPVNPKRVKEELVGARQYYDYHERCVFCDMIRQEGETGDRIVFENNNFIALAPFASRFPFEVWVLPKQHCCDFAPIDAGMRGELSTMLKTVLVKLKKGLNDPAYNYVLHTAPFRRHKGTYWRTIEYDYHWHIEIIPRLTRVAGFEWGTGFYICPVTPEDAAVFLRNTAA